MNKETKIIANDLEIPVYISHPAQGPHAAVIIIHEIWGLNDNIREIADRVAAEGYYALAPDLFAGTSIEEAVSGDLLAEMHNLATKDEAQKKMRAALAPMQSPDFSQKMLTKLQACYDFLLQQDEVNGNIAMLGFCFGGTYAFAFAIEQPGLKAAIPFYGGAPEPVEKVEKISCPVLAFYGEQDTRLIEQLPKLEEAMKKFNKDFEAIVYPNAGHAFFNKDNTQMYRPEAAEDAWARTLAFLSTRLNRI